MGLEFKTCPSMACLEGVASTGKTTRLMERVGDLVENGTPLDEILVVAASPTACQEFARRLGRYLTERLPGTKGAAESGEERNACALPRIATARELALEILATDGARAFNGGRARMLLPHETDFLVEDLKTTGVPPKRLREMLKFLHRSLTEMADDEEGWLYSEEEEAVFSSLERYLAAAQATIEPQAANLAVKYLRKAGGTPLYAHVLADDFTLLSAASQVLCSLLASESLWVAGNPLAGHQAFDSFPSPHGLERFAALPQVKTVTLTEATCGERAFEAMCRLIDADEKADAGGGEPRTERLRPTRREGSSEGTLAVRAWRDPEEELLGEAELVRALLDEGAVSPVDVFVASESPRWRKATVKALTRYGVPAVETIDPRRLASDGRDPAKCRPSRALAALALAARPNDPLPWRTWCGFGDHLLGSRVFERLSRRAEEESVSYRAILESMLAPGAAPEVEGEPDEDLARVVEAFRRGLAFLEGVDGLAGAQLVERIERCVLDGESDGSEGAGTHALSLTALCGPVGKSDSAAALFDRAYRRLAFPAFEKRDAVRVGSFAQLGGAEPAVLILSGLVNGSFPPTAFFDPEKTSLEKREKMRVQNARLMADVLGKAQGTLGIGVFGQADLQTAVGLKLRIDRIALRDGERVALVSKSSMLEALEAKA